MHDGGDGGADLGDVLVPVDVAAHDDALCAGIQCAADVVEDLRFGLGFAAAQDQDGGIAALRHLPEPLAAYVFRLDESFLCLIATVGWSSISIVSVAFFIFNLSEISSTSFP